MWSAGELGPCSSGLSGAEAGSLWAQRAGVWELGRVGVWGAAEVKQGSYMQLGDLGGCRGPGCRSGLPSTLPECITGVAEQGKCRSPGTEP